ncbi:MAG TPA: DNA polymerase IV, partial [Actinobacteria bacterium]|nr:DNA polymerase IV [Actinomycetota bacterium]
HDASLRGRPVVVGGTGPRGVVAAASYEARRHGVRSAMPVSLARRRCPGLVVVPPHRGRYVAAASEVFAILESFTPVVERISIDEAFLDVAGLRLRYPDAVVVAEEIRRRIRREVGLPASVGVASNRFVAKVASGRAKPDGLLVVARGSEEAFLAPMPVETLWGVGPATAAALASLGVVTVGDLAAVPPATLRARLGTTMGDRLHELARGRDPRSGPDAPANRSVSVEETFAADVRGAEALERELRALCERLDARLRRAGVVGRTVVVKVRFADFRTVTRSTTAAAPMGSSLEVWPHALSALARARVGDRPVRLLGVGLTGVVAAGEGVEQLSFDAPRRASIASVAAEIKARFGDDVLVPGRLLGDPDGPERSRRGSVYWPYE